MLYLSTFLHCKCIFLSKILVVLNKTPIFAVCYYKTHENILTIHFNFRNNESITISRHNSS